MIRLGRARREACGQEVREPEVNPGAELDGRRHPEGGSVMLLILGYAVIALLAITVLAGATGLYLAERRLVAIADAAALSAAEAYDLQAAVPSADGVIAPLVPEDVEASVRGYVDRLGDDRFEQLEVAAATTDDGRSVRVTLIAVWQPPLLSELLPAGVRLEATSEARGTLR